MNEYKAICWVNILKPHEQESMFPMDINVEVLPEGLSVSFSEAGVAGLNGFTRAAIIGMYHWLNSKNNTNPLVMPYSAMEKVFCDFYQREGSVTRYVESTEEPLDAVPNQREMRIRIVYRNDARGTKLKVKLTINDDSGNTDNEAARALYNAILEKQ